MASPLPLAFFLCATITASAKAPPDPITIYGDVHPAPCGLSTGAISAFVSGGLPPYSYDWSPDPGSGEGTPEVANLAPGDWTLTVTDAEATQISETFTVIGLPDLLGGEFDNPAQDSHANCPGQCWGQFRVPESYLPGFAPYQYSEPIAGVDILGEPYFFVPGGACGGESYQITITDAAACSGVMTVYIAEPQTGAAPWAVTNITGSCTGGSGGAVSFTNVYDGMFFTAPNLNVYDMLDNYVAGQQQAGQNVTITGLPPGQYRAQRDWNWFYQFTSGPCDLDVLLFEIPDLGAACGTVSGDVFIDNDQDCAQGGGEVSVPELVLQIEPGATYAITDAVGHFSVDLGDGSYTLAQNDAMLIQLCPVTAPVPFTIAGDAQIIDLADSSTVQLDLEPWIASGAARPGFAFQYVVKVRNNAPQVSGQVTLTLDFDANVLVYVGASLLPTSVVGDVIVWELPPMTAYTQTIIGVDFTVPVATTLGTPISANLFVTNTLPEGNVTNNFAPTTTIVTGSFDPNEKVVATSTGLYPDVFVIDGDEYLDYTIRFQNTGTDTAFTVVITDTLNNALDMATFQQGVASHPYALSFKPDRVVEWRFDNILLPDSGTNEVESHGLVQFRIRPAQPLLPGTLISNAANIYFDFNEPVITEPSVLVAEFSTSDSGSIGSLPRFAIYPNPTMDGIDVLSDGVILHHMSITALDGRIVLDRTMNGTRTHIDLAGVAAGTYVLLVQGSDGTIHRTSLIKQNP